MLERMLNGAPLAPPARPEFRADLRDRFVSGELDWASPEFDADEPTLFERGPRSAATERPTGSGPWGLRIVLPFAAAAAAVLFVLRFDRGPRWSVRPAGGFGEVAAGDGDVADLDADGLAALAAAWTRGESLGARDRALLVELGDTVRLRLQPGTSARLAGDAAPEGEDAALDVRIAQGRVVGETGPAYRAGSLSLTTDHLAATVVGTTFVVDALELGSCFCVAEGAARVVERASGRRFDVGDAGSLFLYADGREPTRSSLVEGGGHLGDAAHAREHARDAVEFTTGGR